jgi:hypothetical protein
LASSAGEVIGRKETNDWMISRLPFTIASLQRRIGVTTSVPSLTPILPPSLPASIFFFVKNVASLETFEELFDITAK